MKCDSNLLYVDPSALIRQIARIDEVEGWPESVPILSADNFCRLEYTRRRGECHCLVGWIRFTFVRYSSLEDFVTQLMRDLVYRIDGVVCATRRCYRLCFAYTLETYNDAEKNGPSSFEKLAHIWNACMALLGYTEGNPKTEWAENLVRDCKRKIEELNLAA